MQEKAQEKEVNADGAYAINSSGQRSGRFLGRGGLDERVDNAEFECDSILEGDCECNSGLDRVTDLDLTSSFCD